MKSKLTFIVAFFCLSFTYAQVGINTVNPNALFDIQASNQATPSNTDGVLIPKIDDFPATSPTVNQDGMMVFATGSGVPAKGFYFWDNTSLTWKSLSGALEKLDEGNGEGWRIIGRAPANFGNIGLGAVDLSVGLTPSTVFGATGDYSFAMGKDAIASGLSSTAIGFLNTASNVGAVAMGGQTTASGYRSTSLGGQNLASGDFATAMGYRNYAESFGCVTIGIDNEVIPFTGATFYVATDPLFIIGNGSGPGLNRSNAMVILKNGNTTINGTISGTIEAPIDATLNASWTVYSSSYSNPGYYKDNERVFLRGLLRKTGAYVLGEVIFVLPVGYRPTARKLCAGGQVGKNVRVDILANGEVHYMNGSNGSNFISLEDISFDTN